MAWLIDDGSSSLDVRYSLDGRSSLHDLDHISGYYIPYLIRQSGQISPNMYKGILDYVR